MKKIILSLLITSFSYLCLIAQNVTGIWDYTDVNVLGETYRVEVFINEDKLYGIIAATFPPKDRNRLCTSCKNELKNKPLEGMTIIYGLENFGDYWYAENGFLDTNKGKFYNCFVWEEDNVLIVQLQIKDLYKTFTWFNPFPTPYNSIRLENRF